MCACPRCNKRMDYEREERPSHDSPGTRAAWVCPDPDCGHFEYDEDPRGEKAREDAADEARKGLRV